MLITKEKGHGCKTEPKRFIFRPLVFEILLRKVRKIPNSPKMHDDIPFEISKNIIFVLLNEIGATFAPLTLL